MKSFLPLLGTSAGHRAGRSISARPPGIGRGNRKTIAHISARPPGIDVAIEKRSVTARRVRHSLAEAFDHQSRLARRSHRLQSNGDTHSTRSDQILRMDQELDMDELVYDVVGAFYTVYNYFGYGLHESVYMEALTIELTERHHHVDREVCIRLSYRGRRLRSLRIDRVIDGKLILEGKAAEKLTLGDERQLSNYLRLSPYQVGLLLHFGPSPYFKRMNDSPKQPLGEPRDPMRPLPDPPASE